jgi:Lon protease-like protein
MGAYGFRKPEDLPPTIPVFPLAGVLLFPRSALPLNIFEPRYLNMIDDALAGDRLIGLIQPLYGETQGEPELCAVGCVGRLTSYAETDDGRYLITLTGLCRFRARREAPASTPYRRIEASYAEFGGDLTDAEGEADVDRARLGAALRHYAEAHGLKADWGAIEAAPGEALINTLAMICPFAPDEKQALLEAANVRARGEALIALLEIDSAPDCGGSSSVQ